MIPTLLESGVLAFFYFEIRVEEFRSPKLERFDFFKMFVIKYRIKY